VWEREVDGVVLTFHLAGINNQNFLMRDEETGTYWQQISGAAISGPLTGKHLRLAPFDELTFAMWLAEEPGGTVLQDLPEYVGSYAKKDWDVRMKKVPTVLSHAQPGLADRDLMLGIQAFGASRAVRFDDIVKEGLINDHVGSEPVMLVVGPDGASVRVFRSRLADGRAASFYRTLDAQSGALMMDDVTGSKWSFRGCGIDGTEKGRCLERVEAIKDYWFDWRQYNPATTVYQARR
jgi:hypothetical protein